MACTLQDGVWINQAETGMGEEHMDFLNGGLAYVQNASPNGPAAFMNYETLMRVLRYVCCSHYCI